jgi:4-hydroxybenzoate polyprenyltransferase
MDSTAPLARARPALAARLLAYQRERFPLAAYVPLIGVSSGAAALWSAGARGASLPALSVLAAGAATGIVFFFLLRVADEHKDAAQDRVARPELPVPRGLVTLGELRAAGAALAVGALAANALLAPRLLLPLGAAAIWAALMSREFFAGEWLRARPAAYLMSHMGVMPLLFLYFTGIDWVARGEGAPPALAAFLALAFLNGVLVEVGRKLRAPADERPGVDSYTAAWGVRAAPGAWLAALVLAAAAAWAAAWAAGAPTTALFALPVLMAALALPALAFLRRPSGPAARGVEGAAAAWTLASYVLLAVVALP